MERSLEGDGRPAISLVKSAAPDTSGYDSAPVRHTSRRITGAVGVGAAVGTGLIALSYRLASHGVGNYWQFHVFWLGFFVVFAPISWFILQGTTKGVDRLGLLAVAGLAAYLPHYLRAPKRPFLNDELAHFWQAQHLYASRRLFQPNPIVAQAANYPGLHTLTVGLRDLTGLGTYQIGVITIATMHVCTVLCVYLLAQAITSDEIACLSALIYAINPQFGVMDSIYAYESLGLPLCAGAIAAAVTASKHSGRRARGGLLTVSALLLVASIFTHHLSSYLTLVALFVLYIGWMIFPDPSVGRRAATPLLGVAVAGTVLAVAWAYVRDAHTFSYLSIYIRNGFESLSNSLVGGGKRPASRAYVPTSETRTPLSNSDKPLYEILATFAAQLILLILSAAGIWQMRRHRMGAALFAIIFSLLYFVSLPLLVTAGGQNAAHRSWAFTYLGLSVTVAVGLQRALLPVTERRHRATRTVSVGGPSPSRMAARRLDGIVRRRLAGTICVLILLLGAWGAGVNTYVAFPGKFVFQSDGRNTPAELYDLGSWFLRTQGPNNVVLADYRTSVILTAIGDQRPDVVAAADLLIPIAPTRQAVSTARRIAQYVVVDERLATDRSDEGFDFYEYEPFGVEPLPTRNLNRLNHYTWLRVTHRTTHYIVYKVAR